MAEAVGGISTTDPHKHPAQVPAICEYDELSLLFCYTGKLIWIS